MVLYIVVTDFNSTDTTSIDKTFMIPSSSMNLPAPKRFTRITCPSNIYPLYPIFIKQNWGMQGYT